LLLNFSVKGASCTNDATRENDKTPILIVIPGLTSDSGSAVSPFYHFEIEVFFIFM
jgi:hypothetical protein